MFNYFNPLNPKEVIWEIQEWELIPFRKRYYVYRIINGHSKWVAKFKKQEDAVRFARLS